MAFELDELEPQSQPNKPTDISGWSAEDLKAYIEALKAEIARAEAVIAARKGQISDAEQIFKK
ncbi:MAG TPA: DUF1192 domain-containing protein [Alphaproteobacteria bacterium]|nr:DUF1192 domain-containing protein [Alphaproteobacteria bacterium]